MKKSSPPLTTAPGPSTERALALAEAERQRSEVRVRLLQTEASGAAEEVARQSSHLNAATEKHDALVAAERTTQLRLSAHRLQFHLLHAIEPSITRLGGLLITGAMGAAVMLVVAIVREAAADIALGLALMGLGVGLLAWMPIFLLPTQQDLQRKISAAYSDLSRSKDCRELLKEDLKGHQAQLAAAQAARDVVSGKLTTADAELRGAVAKREEARHRNDMRHWLRAQEIHSMTGIEFEQFLAQVFTVLGFSVEATKVSNDQGGDLLLTRSGRRVCVQAKRRGHSIGNGAVQEAHTAMAFYDCSACAVITNSTFTRPARRLADKIGCTLVDGGQIHALIDGGVAF